MIGVRRRVPNLEEELVQNGLRLKAFRQHARKAPRPGPAFSAPSKSANSEGDGRARLAPARGGARPYRLAGRWDV